MEGPTRLVAVLLLHHGDRVAAEFRENGDRRFASSVDPIDTPLPADLNQVADTGVAYFEITACRSSLSAETERLPSSLLKNLARAKG
jgi:hypothetical protein